ncbi:MAG TPA: SIS domain-containing protein [Terriglobales bacterium]
MNSISNCRTYFELLSKTIDSLPFESVDRITATLVQAYEHERTILLFGNGGSAALASHIACDLGKGTVNGTRKRFRVIALTDNVPLITAWANDSKYEDIFAQQLANFAAPGDIAFAISASGNSPNVLQALRVAKDIGSTTIGITGFSGGRMLALCDECVVVPCDNMQIIEDLHTCIAHSLFTCIRSKIDGHAASPYAAMGPRLVARTGTK